MKRAFITGITGNDGSYLAEFCAAIILLRNLDIMGKLMTL
jgi:GDP-D-mannose dehydratase